MCVHRGGSSSAAMPAQGEILAATRYPQGLAPCSTTMVLNKCLMKEETNAKQ